MSCLKLSPEESMVVLCCSIDPDDNRLEKVDNLLSKRLCWDHIFKISNLHGVSSLILKNFEQCKNRAAIPSLFLKKFEKEYHKTAYKNLLFTNEYKKIVLSFNKKNIKIIPLKGIAFLEQIYNNIGLRPFSDIDVLVEKNNIDCAEKILTTMGYRKKKESALKIKRHFHSVYWKKIGPVIIPLELHWDIDFSDSRGGLVGLVFIGACLCLKNIKKMSTFFVVGIVIFLFISFAKDQFEQRQTVETTLSGKKKIDSAGRLTIYSQAFKLWTHYPMLGVGPNRYEKAYIETFRRHPQHFWVHNSFLHILVEQGILGLLFFMAIYILSFKDIARLRNKKKNCQKIETPLEFIPCIKKKVICHWDEDY